MSPGRALSRRSSGRNVSIRSSNSPGGDRLFQLTLLPEMQLGTAGGGGQDGKRIGTFRRMAAPVKNGNELAKIHAGLEPAPLRAGDALQREGVGYERPAGLGESEPVNRDAFSFRLLPQRVQLRLATAVHRLADKHQNARSRGRTLFEKLNPVKAGIDHPSVAALGGNFPDRGWEVSSVKGFENRDVVVVRNHGIFASLSHQQSFQRASHSSEKRNVGPNILIGLHGQNDGDRCGGRVERQFLQMAIVEDSKVGRIEIGNEPVFLGKYQRGNRHQPNRDTDGRRLLRDQQARRAERPECHPDPHGATFQPFSPRPACERNPLAKTCHACRETIGYPGTEERPLSKVRNAAFAVMLLCQPAATLLGQTAPAVAPPGDVLGVNNFAHIVANLDGSLAFYRDVLGLEPSFEARPFDGNPAIMKMGNTIGAQSRYIALKVPGSAIGVELIEYKDIDRKPAHPRFQDPGAGNLALRVRDLDSVLAKVKKSTAHIITVGGEPAVIGGNARIVFVQDADGFIVELAQPSTVPATAPAGNIIGGGFELTVDNLEKTAPFYKLLGMEASAPAAFNGDKLMTNTAGTPGAQFRQSRAPIPGTSAVVTFIEFKDIDRKPLHTRTQDLVTAFLQLTVRDVDALLAKIKAAGGTVVSVGGEAVSLPGIGKIAIVCDPNNLHLELIQRQAR